LLVAGTIPTKIKKLILVEGLGPFINPVFSAPEQLEIAVKEKPSLLKRQRRIYPNIQMAINRYLQNNPNIKPESAKLLVKRGTEEVTIVGSEEEGICFSHDPRLTGKELIKFSGNY
jgi:hypothetical protein